MHDELYCVTEVYSCCLIIIHLTHICRLQMPWVGAIRWASSGQMDHQCQWDCQCTLYPFLATHPHAVPHPLCPPPSIGGAQFMPLLRQPEWVMWLQSGHICVASLWSESDSSWIHPQNICSHQGNSECRVSWCSLMRLPLTSCTLATFPSLNASHFLLHAYSLHTCPPSF